MEIDDNLFLEIKEFCELNEIVDIKKEIHKMLLKGFNIEKYGYSPFQTIQPIKEGLENTKQDVEEKPKRKVGRPKKNISNDNKNELEKKEAEIIKKEEVKPKRRVRIIKND